jgi:hypothetical protein
VSQAPTSVEAVSPAPAQQGLRPWWRGWGSREAPNNGLVTSSRLPSAAGVQNRLFPKTRSWFALGAPLELLSPLSVARALVAFNAVAWLSAGIAWARLGLTRLWWQAPGQRLAGQCSSGQRRSTKEGRRSCSPGRRPLAACSS